MTETMRVEPGSLTQCPLSRVHKYLKFVLSQAIGTSVIWDWLRTERQGRMKLDLALYCKIVKRVEGFQCRLNMTWLFGLERRWDRIWSSLTEYGMLNIPTHGSSPNTGVFIQETEG